MMTEITPAEAREQYGISTSHQIMPNGEKRFRLIDRNGLGYVRTEAGPTGAWQNSHLHNQLVETYIVQAGWIAIASVNKRGALRIGLIQKGGMWSAPIGEAHNVYMSGSSITHTVKHGIGSGDDWVTSPETELLDRLAKVLGEPEILRRADSRGLAEG